MIAIITEKPSVAQSIAQVMGITNKKEGYFEGNGYLLTWSYGHLVRLALPEEYGYKGFKKENLPIIPRPFRLTVRNTNTATGRQKDKKAEKQLHIIKKVFDRAESIIAATDAGREGELIFRYIYFYLGCQKPFSRLWISSLTDQAIQEGFANLKPETDMVGLFRAAQARSMADWLVGINASQALCIVAGKGNYSLGRVQSPTLAMICKRYLEHMGFTPSTYYQLKLNTQKGTTAVSALCTTTYDQKEEALLLQTGLLTQETATVVKVEKTKVVTLPPLLYDLTTLQKEMNQKFGFSAQQTLDLAQRLYEKKLITYPRTGSRYIPQDMVQEIYTLVTALWTNFTFSFQAMVVHNSELNGHSVDDRKVTDHHAILTTMNTPESLPACQKLPEEEALLYERIAGRMVEAFSEESIAEVITVRMRCGELLFDTKSSTLKQAGWRSVFNEKEVTEDTPLLKLPKLLEGEELPVQGIDLLEKQTKARPIHTESSLLSAMVHAGEDLEDENQRIILKQCGIGTPATRAAIIETLINRQYIVRKKKQLIPSDKGLHIYTAIQNLRIANVELTGEWETALAQIEKEPGYYTTFIEEIENYTSLITKDVLSLSLPGKSTQMAKCCPKCKNESFYFYSKVGKCKTKECGLTLFRNKGGLLLTDKHLTELCEDSITSLIKGFKNREGDLFNAMVKLDKNFQLVYHFPNRKKGKGNDKPF